MYNRPIVAESGYTYLRRKSLERKRNRCNNYKGGCSSSESISYDQSSNDNNINIQKYEDNNSDIKPMRFPLIYE